MKNWKQKLTSRKFWAAVVGFVTPTLLAFGVADNVATQVAGIIMAGAAVVAYIVGEGLVDASNAGKNDTDTEG
ncbi:MAG: hypothetical protein IJA41_09825 [Clostridia bacterium]|nr:hypothetical protein [Clostridia bacterium]